MLFASLYCLTSDIIIGLTYMYMALFFTKNLFQNRQNSFMTHFLTQFILAHASDNTTSQNIGGTDAWAVPPPQIFVGTVPQSLSLRPC